MHFKLCISISSYIFLHILANEISKTIPLSDYHPRFVDVEKEAHIDKFDTKGHRFCKSKKWNVNPWPPFSESKCHFHHNFLSILHSEILQESNNVI